MKRVLGSVAAAVSLTAPAPAAAAAAPAASAAQSDEAAKLAEARAIIAIMYPAGRQQQMIDKMMDQLTAPMRSMPIETISDPGLKAMMRDQVADMFKMERPVFMKHFPALEEAMAVAYAHQLTLGELKDLHAFAASPSGRTFFDRLPAMMGDPAVQKVDAEMLADVQTQAKTRTKDWMGKLDAYLKAHPDAAAQLATRSEAKAQAK